MFWTATPCTKLGRTARSRGFSVWPAPPRMKVLPIRSEFPMPSHWRSRPAERAPVGGAQIEAVGRAHGHEDAARRDRIVGGGAQRQHPGLAQGRVHTKKSARAALRKASRL